MTEAIVRRCDLCFGSGAVYLESAEGMGTCARCNGSGRHWLEPQPESDSGRSQEQDTQ